MWHIISGYDLQLHGACFLQVKQTVLRYRVEPVKAAKICSVMTALLFIAGGIWIYMVLMV